MHRPFYRQAEAIGSTLALRPRQAAAAISVSLSTLERLTRSGEIPVVRLGRIRLYELSALESFLKSRRTAGEEVTA